MIVGKSLVDGRPDQLLDLVWGKRWVVRYPVEEEAHAVRPSAHLPHPVDETPRVPNRRDVRVGHEKRRVRSTHRRASRRVGQTTGVDYDERVRLRQDPQELLDSRRVVSIRTVRLFGPRHDVETRSVVRDDLFEEDDV